MVLCLIRDIKPPNVAVTRDFGVRILDLGMVVELPGGDQPILNLGFPVGTIGYVCPEVLACGDFHPLLADAYSLGIVVYETVTGMHAEGDLSKAPFPADVSTGKLSHTIIIAGITGLPLTI